MAALTEFPPTYYPAALFTHAQPTFHSCGVCLNVLKDAVSCMSGHTFCRSCAETWKSRSNECPACKVKLEVLVPNRFANDAVAEIEVVCFTRLAADGNVKEDKKDESKAGVAASNRSSSSSGSDGGEP